MTTETDHPPLNTTQIGTLTWAHALPKIDLHRHLEGSLRLNSLMEIASEYNIDLPDHGQELLSKRVQITHTALDFNHFLQIFDVLRPFFRSKELIQRFALEVIKDAARDNVRYLELRFNPMALAKTQNFAFSDVVAWVTQAVKNAQIENGIRTCLILQIPRKESLEIAEEIVDIAIAYQGEFVRGIDLAGDEKLYPSDDFTQPFHRAYEAGLHITVHAGEASGGHSIHDAVMSLHAQRIGHGIRAVESTSVLNLLKEHETTLEICPTSNIKTNLVSDYAHHPLAALDKYGLRITLNTDDPGIFVTTSSQEILTAVHEIDIPPQHIYRFLRYGVEAAFIPEEERPWLRKLFSDALAPYPDALDEYNTTGV